MFRKRVIALSIVMLMIASVFTGISFLITAEDVGTDPIEDISSAPAGVQLNDIAWHPDENIAVAVGNDSTNGYIYRYEPDADNWANLRNYVGDTFKGVTRTEPWTFFDDAESDAGWTINSWRGNLDWERKNPTVLPVPGSGISHDTAYSGNSVWWFGNTTTGDYNDNNQIVRGSMISPVKHIPNISTNAYLSFQHWFDVESGGSYDYSHVYIKNTTDPGWTNLYTWNSGWVSSNGGAGTHSKISWTQERYDISDWIGNDVLLNFTFDSGGDGSANNYAGWHIDDIQLESNGIFMAVGNPGGGSFSAFYTDGYSPMTSVEDLAGFDLYDVAAGPIGTAVAVGAGGAALYWDGEVWQGLSGPAGTDTLASVDCNGSHYFIVGYDSGDNGIGFFITANELATGNYDMHSMPGAPTYKLNSVSWSNDCPAGSSDNGLGIIAGEGNILGLTNPEFWRQKDPSTVPTGRRNQAMSWDEDYNQMIMFGGSSGVNLGDTWAYDIGNDEWNNLNPGGAPSAREYPRMVYSPTDNVHIMFGGNDGGGYDDETWVYNYATNSWTNKNPNPRPPTRSEHTMAYDEVYQKVILFGGKNNGGNLADTWAYDYRTNTWTNMTPTISGIPSARFLSGMSYDAMNEKTIMFSGWGSSGAISDTWAYDYPSNTWTDMSPVPSPTARDRHAMTFDKAIGRSVVHAGWTGANVDDTWTYDYGTNTWEEMTTPTRPSYRFDMVMAYATQGVIVMFGGNYPVSNDETWLCRLNVNPWGEPSSVTNGESFTDTAWDTAGTTAIVVGHNTISAVLYSYQSGDEDVTKLQDLNNVLAGHELYGVSWRPLDHGAEYAMAVGASAFKLWSNVFDDGTEITVSTDKPHIFQHGLWKTADGLYSASKLDSQLDVRTTYTFFAEVNYTIGDVDDLMDADGNSRIEVMAWYDEGNTGTSNPEPSWASVDNRTRQFRLMWFEQNGPVPATASMLYPIASPGIDEFQLDGWWMDPIAYGADGNTRRFFFNVTLGPQTWAADGNGFSNGIGVPSHDKGVALNDPDSWDFRVRLYDNNFVNSANLSFGEFGIFRYTNITVAGNPGGNAPPGTMNSGLGPQSQITYSSNIPHYVNVSVGDLNRQGGGGSIAATNINVSLQNDLGIGLNPYTEINDDTWPNGRAFTGAGLANDRCVWGNRTQLIKSMPAPKNGTTSHGPWGSDFNSMGVTYINWWANVPGATPEGIYQASVTFTIEY